MLFLLQLDDDEYTYQMRYDAVLKYADEEDANFNKFRLPEGLLELEDPEGEEVVAPAQRRGRRLERTSNHRRTNRTINNDLSADDTPIEDDEASENPASSSDEESDDEGEQNNTIYTRTDPSEWKRIGGRSRAHIIEPIPFTGDNKIFTINITDDELKGLKDNSGDIRFEKVFEWLLPTFGEDDQTSFFEFIAARMRNYMVYIQCAKDFKPKYYDPTKGNTIQPNDVARFYGCHLARMLRGVPSIDETWSTRESLDAVGAVKDSMPKDAYIDMYRCMHFSDDWEEEDGEVPWESIYADEKYEPSPQVERHRRKYEHIEDGFNRRWKECVNFGRWITADESRVAGWYKSGITIGPEPKPIRTGATIHSICVTHGNLRTYKLHCWVYGGKHDEGLNHVHHNTAITQKWVNLYDEMLEEFKGMGMCMMDSAYMGDVMVMGQIGREVWEMNFVGTCQADRTGADAKEIRKNMTVGTYESEMFQHITKPLSYTMWSDNNIVKILSNFHTPEVLVAAEGVRRKRRVDGVREQEMTEVSCPVQQKDYSETFHLIDKGNGKESKYDMGVHSESSENDNASVCENLSHSLMQRGPPMRSLRPEQPHHIRNLVNIFDYGAGRKLRTDAKGTVARGIRGAAAIAAPNQRMRQLRKKQKKAVWRMHQSMACEKRGKCHWENCPGMKKESGDDSRKRKRSYNTYMRCEECSAREGKNIFLCNDVKSRVPVLCHLVYHSKYHNKQYEDGN
ncbi:hypothetical protein ACHAXR_007787 [Thalassiosira sp. AJA248-18]